MKRLAIILVCIAAFIAVLWVFVSPDLAEWRYKHLVSLDEKIRRLNEESPWNIDDIEGGPLRLFYPGGCGVIPYSREIVMIQSFDPLILAVCDGETGEVRTITRTDDRTFQFTSTCYPIEITIIVTEVFPDSISFNIRAAKAGDTR